MFQKQTETKTKSSTLKRRIKLRRVNEVCDYHKNRSTTTKPTLFVVPILCTQKTKKKQPNNQEQIKHKRPKAPRNLTQALVTKTNFERKRSFLGSIDECTDQLEIGTNNNRIVVGEFGFVIEENNSMENVNFDW
ncbi:hypothetical protein M0812_09537 [Anaeramoeba flamelloides]|uniref:Uncharacterized protein n=1 Tax=Anaeramoeba flamelloides TaxID=1746091 RepID=A0AAV7ZNU5_9EUKA|nr:hypothetical protein M0812_09537 [Anaeramoeba flamelloides]|eukprot:Anaeramoba_flamelloidesa1053826_25.p1 GENE.a1053826_25~~a1053826_25.p1  ORF type:complete len:134 (+),score=32.52 a1053826_25:210-611(+)